ncbi:MAG: hypothetical protein NTZ69_15775 [Bacteroidia bacterium]|nr:hypothetical protein [Bacteroidia bacterium]
MNNPESQKIVLRFFEALAMLKAQKVIRGKQTFTRQYEINRWNMNQLEKDPGSNIFQVSWLSHLVTDYGVSSQWLLTGHGEMFSKKKLIHNESETVLYFPARSGARQDRCKTPASSEVGGWSGSILGGVPCRN